MGKLKEALVEGRGQMACWGRSRQEPKVSPSLYSKEVVICAIWTKWERIPLWGIAHSKPGSNYYSLVSNHVTSVRMEHTEPGHSHLRAQSFAGDTES